MPHPYAFTYTYPYTWIRSRDRLATVHRSGTTDGHENAYAYVNVYEYGCSSENGYGNGSSSRFLADS